MTKTDKPMPAENPFSIMAQFIKDVSFENILVRNADAPEIDGEPEILVTADISTKTHGNTGAYEVSLTVHVITQYKEQKIFIAEVTNAAVVSFDEKFIKEYADYVDPTLCIEIPFYLFFEARNLIANLSNMGGYPPVFVRPIDFGALYQEKLQGSGTKQ